MSFELSEDDLERHLATMLRERATSLSDRVAVDRAVIGRARRRRTVKLASVGSGVALAAAVLVAVVLTVGTPFSSSSSKPLPASRGPSLSLTTPLPRHLVGEPQRPGWMKLPPAPIGARAASAAAIAGDAFVVWGGAGQHDERLDDGAWYDRDTGVWHLMSKSPLPVPSYPPGHHFTIAQAIGDSVVIVNDGAVAQYTPATDEWSRLPGVPLAQLDNLALTDASSGDAIALTGVDDEGRAAYAVLNFDPTGRAPVWTAGTLTGRSVGRPAITASGLVAIVRRPEGLRLDKVVGLSGPASESVAPTIPPDFVPTAWTGRWLVGGCTGHGCGATTAFLVDPHDRTSTKRANAYDACLGLHIWSGRAVLSWGVPGCRRRGLALAYDLDEGSSRPIPTAPIAERRVSDFAVSGGFLFVWGGEDASGNKLDDGAVLSLG